MQPAIHALRPPPLPAPLTEPVTPQEPGWQWVFSGRDEWQAGLRSHLLPMQCLPKDPAFKCHAVITRLCGNPAADLRVEASRLLRREADIGAGDAGQVLVLWQLSGRSGVHQGRNSAILAEGGWAVLDSRREFQIDFDQRARCLVLLMPQAQCSGWLGAAEAISALALPTSGPAQVAMAMLAALLRNPAQLDERSERALHNAVVAMIDHALTRELGSRGLPAQARRQVDPSHVRDYVMDQLEDRTLSVERVAAAFGISRRSLHKLFAQAGATPSNFILQARMARARALLSDPDWCEVPILRIAQRCGFANAAHFSRAFHAQHGAAPSAWRRRNEPSGQSPACTRRQADFPTWQQGPHGA